MATKQKQDEPVDPRAPQVVSDDKGGSFNERTQEQQPWAETNQELKEKDPREPQVVSPDEPADEPLVADEPEDTPDSEPADDPDFDDPDEGDKVEVKSKSQQKREAALAEDASKKSK